MKFASSIAIVVLLTVVLVAVVSPGASTASPSAAPRLKRVYIEVTHPNLAQYLRFNFTKTAPSCSAPNPSKVKISMRSGSIDWVTAAKWCRNSLGDLNWHGGEHGFWLQVLPVGPTVELFPQKFRTATRVFGYWVVIDGKLVGKGRVWVRVVNHGNLTIWEEEDDFVNICINENKTIRKSGGRLYCTISAGVDYSLKLLR